MRDLGQLITAMVTPFKENLEVDYNKAAELAEMLVDNGSDSILVLGTTGESPTLNHDEKIELVRVVKEVVGNKVPIIAGTGTNNTQATIKFTREIEKIGVDAVLVVCPYYNKPPQEGIYEHYRLVSENVNTPVIVYNIQGRTGINITPETMKRISDLPNIIADKEASGNVEQCSQIVISTGAMKAYAAYRPVTAGAGARFSYGGDNKTFMVYSGDDSLTLPMMSVGAVGVISVASHVAGNQMKKMIKHYFSGETEEALKIHNSLMPVFKGLFKTSNPILVKSAIKMVHGINTGSLRPPLVKATAAEEETLRNDLKSAGLL